MGIVIAVAVGVAFLVVDGQHKVAGSNGTPVVSAPSAQASDAASPTATATSASTSQFKLFLQQMEAWMQASSAGRSAIIRAVNGTYAFALQPSEALALVNQVISNRQSLLAQVEGMPQPTNDQARRMLSLMQTSLAWSLTADKAFAAWINESAQAQNSGANRAPLNHDYQVAFAASKTAGTAKTALARLVNGSAAPYGLRSNWTSADF
jgi:ribosomal protein S11